MKSIPCRDVTWPHGHPAKRMPGAFYIPSVLCKDELRRIACKSPSIEQVSDSPLASCNHTGVHQSDRKGHWELKYDDVLEQ
eukprot:1139613-Pelagomonas_calceolata.AAC.7